ncbi:hypothetical protein [Corynebacterium heidelbergense]|nr:hypothetical protein [Corynebacterium heidelbergense]
MPSPSLGGGAQAAARRSSAEYPRFAAGPNTTEGFAQNVYDTFIQQWVSTGNANQTVVATSPSTSKTYTMSCSGGATVHCVGGNDAHVYIYSDAGGGGSAPSGGAAGGGAPAPGTSGGSGATGNYTFTGTVRAMSMQEFKASYQPEYPNQFAPGERVVFLQLDAPATVTAKNGGDNGSRESTTRELFLDYGQAPLRSQYANRNGEHVSITVDLSQCRWPSDTRPPLGSLGCAGVS